MQRRTLLAGAIGALFGGASSTQVVTRLAAASVGAEQWPEGVQVRRGHDGACTVYFPPGVYSFSSPVVTDRPVKLVRLG